MLSEREILLRNVKCAAAREGIYFISLDASASNFTMTEGHYFTFATNQCARINARESLCRHMYSIGAADSSVPATNTRYSGKTSPSAP